MHEMSYVVKFVNDAIDAAVAGDAKKVVSITVSVGEMTDAVRGTILEGSELIVDTVPVKTVCLKCGESYHPVKDNGYTCPHCGDSAGRVIAGRDVVLERVEVC